MTPDDLIHFENRVADAWRNGELNSLFHLGGGNEQQLIRIFENIRPQDYVFATHRSHYHALLKGMEPDDLYQRIRDGKSMFLFDRRLNFLTSSIVAGTPGIAAGVALAIKLKGEDRHVYCFVGDAAMDNGHSYEAILWAASMDLPLTVIVEDNDRSCDVAKHARGAHWPLLSHGKVLKRYHYTRTTPHCQAPCDHKIEFKRPTR